METKVTTTEMLFEQVENYAKTSLEILELKLVAKSADALSIFTSGIVILVVVALFCFILSIGLSYYIGQFFIYDYYGFFIVASFYLLVLIIMYFNKFRLIRKPLKNLIIFFMLDQQKN
jgi:hypothetical protein